MEEEPLLPDRKLLAKLVLVREEARSLMGGGILDERNDNKGFKNFPEPEVYFADSCDTANLCCCRTTNPSVPSFNVDLM
jgi:hypothetical protein